LQDFRFNWG